MFSLKIVAAVAGGIAGLFGTGVVVRKQWNKKFETRFTKLIHTDPGFQTDISNLSQEYNARMKKMYDRSRGTNSKKQTETKFDSNSIQTRGDLIKAWQKSDWLKMKVHSAILLAEERHKKEVQRIATSME